jgi:hypothetical protein
MLNGCKYDESYSPKNIILQIPIKGNNVDLFRRKVKGNILNVIGIESGTEPDLSDEIVMFIVDCKEGDKQFNTDLGFNLFLNKRRIKNVI